MDEGRAGKKKKGRIRAVTAHTDDITDNNDDITDNTDQTSGRDRSSGGREGDGRNKWED